MSTSEALFAAIGVIAAALGVVRFSDWQPPGWFVPFALGVIFSLAGAGTGIGLAGSDEADDRTVTETTTVTETRPTTEADNPTAPPPETMPPAPSNACAETSDKRGAGYEPNDSVDTAYGPLSGSKQYLATVETDNDEDNYVFCTRQRTQLEIRGRLLRCDESESDCANVFVTLLDETSEELGGISLYFKGASDEIRETVPAGRYYLRVNGDRNQVYDVAIEPAAALSRRGP